MREHLVANNCFIQIEKSDMGLILTILGKYKDFKLGYGQESYSENSEVKLNYEVKF